MCVYVCDCVCGVGSIQREHMSGKNDVDAENSVHYTHKMFDGRARNMNKYIQASTLHEQDMFARRIASALSSSHSNMKMYTARLDRRREEN